jgi:selenocysteine lyase/cysteine desulfurase
VVRICYGIDLPAAVREVAPAILKQHGVYVGMRGESLRVSPHLYTTDADIDRLMEALHRVLGHGNK